jgi:hypothetical protein
MKLCADLDIPFENTSVRVAETALARPAGSVSQNFMRRAINGCVSLIPDVFEIPGQKRSLARPV